MQQATARPRTAIHRSRVLTWAILLLLLGGLVLLIDWLGRPPQSQAAVEAELERPVMAFAQWDGTPYVVFRLDDHIYLDRLRIDWVSVEWPPSPRWQWTGNWSSIDATTDPASAGLANVSGDRVVFGQVNEGAIVAIELEVDGAWRRFPVAGPGYMVRLTGFDVAPSGYRWLDAEGRVVWSAEVSSALEP